MCEPEKRWIDVNGAKRFSRYGFLCHRFCRWGMRDTQCICSVQARRVSPCRHGPAAQAIIAITNRERIQRNLKPLKADRACTLAITGHVKDMARSRYLSHQGRDGRGASERYRQ
jgi:hypothetical protein